MTTVTLEALTKTYLGSVLPAVTDLHLELRSGSLTALLGPSGCGKSTTLALVAGLLTPDHGDILMDGVSLRGTPAERRPFGTVFQRPLLFPHLDVGENVAFGLRMRHVKRPERRRRVAEALARVQLTDFERRAVHELSGGQEQRVALARALVTEPRLLLLDEPFSALDPELRAEMRALLTDVRGTLGTTTLLVTHDQDEAVEVADTVALMLDGRLVQHDEPRAFYERPRSRAAAMFFGATNLLDGTVQGGRFTGSCGELEVAHHGVHDGPATLVVRPERLRLLEGADRNVLPATVIAAEFRGDHLHVTAQVKDTLLVAHLPPTASVCIGARTGVQLPPEACTVVPPT